MKRLVNKEHIVNAIRFMGERNKFEVAEFIKNNTGKFEMAFEHYENGELSHLSILFLKDPAFNRHVEFHTTVNIGEWLTSDMRAMSDAKFDEMYIEIDVPEGV